MSSRPPSRTAIPGWASPSALEEALERAAGEAASRRTSRASPSARCRRRRCRVTSDAAGRRVGSARGRRPPRVSGSGGVRAGRRRPCAILPLRSGPSGPDTLHHDLQRTTHGPLLRDLRQGVDGRLQPPVVGDEPRSSPPPHAAEPPAARHRRQGHADEVARLHPLPAGTQLEVSKASLAAAVGRTTATVRDPEPDRSHARPVFASSGRGYPPRPPSRPTPTITLRLRACVSPRTNTTCSSRRERTSQHSTRPPCSGRPAAVVCRGGSTRSPCWVQAMGRRRPLTPQPAVSPLTPLTQPRSPLSRGQHPSVHRATVEDTARIRRSGARTTYGSVE